MPSGCGSRLKPFAAAERVADRGLAGDDERRLRRRADGGEHGARSVRDQQKG